MIYWSFIEVCMNITIPNIPAIRTLMGRKFLCLSGHGHAQNGHNIHQQNSFFRLKLLQLQSKFSATSNGEDNSCTIPSTIFELVAVDETGRRVEKGNETIDGTHERERADNTLREEDLIGRRKSTTTVLNQETA